MAAEATPSAWTRKLSKLRDEGKLCPEGTATLEWQLKCDAACRVVLGPNVSLAEGLDAVGSIFEATANSCTLAFNSPTLAEVATKLLVDVSDGDIFKKSDLMSFYFVAYHFAFRPPEFTAYVGPLGLTRGRN
jgi:hypothetical protein